MAWGGGSGEGEGEGEGDRGRGGEGDGGCTAEVILLAIGLGVTHVWETVLPGPKMSSPLYPPETTASLGPLTATYQKIRRCTRFQSTSFTKSDVIGKILTFFILWSPLIDEKLGKFLALIFLEPS